MEVGPLFRARSGHSASQHYKVITFEEVAVPASALCSFTLIPDCLVGVGPTPPLGLQLLERWGFRYSGTAFVWAKQNPSGVGWHMGTGFTTQEERRGLSAGTARQGPRQGPRRARADRLAAAEAFPKARRAICANRAPVDGPYLEMFARQRRPGWTAWGDELDKFEPEYDAHDDRPIAGSGLCSIRQHDGAHRIMNETGRSPE